MKICFFSDADTGFLAGTLKSHFIKLGHDCVVMQLLRTTINTHTDYVDYWVAETEPHILREEWSDTDFFVIRSTDKVLYASGILDYLTATNMIYKLHGTDLLGYNYPYSMRTWNINWYGKEPWVVANNDIASYYRFKDKVITTIERPMNFDILPKKKTKYPKYALCSPTDMNKKGGDMLMNTWRKTIPLQIISGVSREEVLQYKAGCSYFIDNVDKRYRSGPYGMNSVEAMYMGIPVFSYYDDIHRVICPNISRLIHKVELDTVEDIINGYSYNRKDIEYAKRYVYDIHNPTTIAEQYIALFEYIIADDTSSIYDDFVANTIDI